MTLVMFLSSDPSHCSMCVNLYYIPRKKSGDFELLEHPHLTPEGSRFLTLERFSSFDKVPKGRFCSHLHRNMVC